MKKFKAVNWNTPDNDYVEMFWEQNLRQFWIDTEYIPSKDIDSWHSLSPQMRDSYMKALGGLTLLDTLQSHTGMPKIIEHIEGLQNKSVLSYMCMMETIHAKSYSTIFTTLTTKTEIDAVFEWVTKDETLQYKARVIDGYYSKLDQNNIQKQDLYMALASSVLLETFLFYSGFFLPLWLSGQGYLIASSDIIRKIIADESIHGVFVGLLAQEIFNKLDEKQKKQIKDSLFGLMDLLYNNELKYTDHIYSNIGLSGDVKEYVRYNGNKALMNLGFDPRYDVKEVNPIVLNGLNVETTQHDFFSKKSINYEKNLEVTYLHDEDFDMREELDILI